MTLKEVEALIHTAIQSMRGWVQATYWRKTDHIDARVSTLISKNKPVKTNLTGYVDNTLMEIPLLIGGSTSMGSTAKIQVTSETGPAYIAAQVFSDTAINEPGLILNRARGSEALPTAIQSGDDLGSIYFQGWDTARSSGARIRAIAAAEWGTAADGTDNPTDLVFYTVPDGSGTLTEVLRLTSEQRMGIMQATPQGILHMHDGATGFLVTSVSVTSGTAVTVIPNGTGDVTQRLDGHFIIDPSTGTTNAGVISVTAPGGLAPGATIDMFNSGGTEVCQLQVAADGSILVQRTAGTRTYAVTLQLIWR